MKTRFGIEGRKEFIDIWLNKNEDSMADRRALIQFMDNFKLGKDIYVENLPGIGGNEDIWHGYRLSYGTNLKKLMRENRKKELRHELEELENEV